MNSPIQAVLFDLGDTLMYSRQPWPPVFDQAGRELAEALCANHLEVDCASFHLDFRQRLDQYYEERDRNLIETSTMQVLLGLLHEKGHRHLSEFTLRPILNHFYHVTQQNWALEADTLSTLSTLQAAGFRLGLVSNAGDSQDVFQLVEKLQIEPFFDFILTSADCGYRKPHPQIFKLALTNWGYLPDEVAMVGDRLEADIHGAKPLGLYTIWITRRAKMVEPPPAVPDAFVKTLAEVPPVLFQLPKP